MRTVSGLRTGAGSAGALGRSGGRAVETDEVKGV
jgi:hypothetical protein